MLIHCAEIYVARGEASIIVITNYEREPKEVAIGCVCVGGKGAAVHAEKFL